MSCRFDDSDSTLPMMALLSFKDPSKEVVLRLEAAPRSIVVRVSTILLWDIAADH